MGSVLGWCMRFRLLVVAVAVGVLGFGVTQLRSAPVDVLPEFAPPYAEVQTEALGLSAHEVEQLITVPLEADLLNGVEGADVIRSNSLPGLSSIVLVFAPGTDVYRARQLIEERLTQAHALPNVSKPPTLLPPRSSSNRLLMVALSSDRLSHIEQSVIARWTIKPRLMGVAGVANVSVWGMRDQQLQVQVDPAQLRSAGVTLNQVVESAGNAQVVSPLTFLEASTPGTGGFIETPQQRLQVRHVLDKIADPQELGKVPVEGTGGRLRLADVSTITVNHQPLIGDAVVAGGSGLMLVVEKLPGASTEDVTKGVESALEDLRPGLSGMRTDTSIFRPASYIDDALGNLGLALLIGGVLMVAGLLALRVNWRALLVIVVTVPLALVVAAVLLRMFGQTFNALTLAGVGAAIAVVVDEAITPTEYVARRLRERRPTGDGSTQAVLQESFAHVRRPLTYAMLVALLAIVPIAVMGGRPGAFFTPLVVGYALAVGAALLVAVTVAPALTAMLAARWQPTAARAALWSSAGQRYADALRRFAARRHTALVAGGACAALGVATLPFLGVSLVPAFHDRDLLVQVHAQPGTSGPRMTEVTGGMVARLRDIPGVTSVGAHVGRAVTGDRITDVNSSDIWVSISPNADYESAVQAVHAAIRPAHSVEGEVIAYSTHSMRSVGALTTGDHAATDGSLDVLTGLSSQLAVRLFGQDYDVLRREAGRVKQLMGTVDGVVEPRIVLPPSQPTVEVEVDLDKAQQFGISPGTVRRAEAVLLQGIQVGSVFEQQKVFDVVVQGVPGVRRSVNDIRNLLIDRPGGGHVRLDQVADVRVVDTPAIIQRDAVSRRLDIAAAVSGRSSASVAADIEQKLATLSFPIEYHAEVLHDTTAAEIGLRRVIVLTLAAAIAVFLLMQAAFRSWRLAVLTCLALPLCLVGGLVAALIDGGTLSLGSLLGLLAVFGLATRSSMLLISALQDRTRRGPGSSSPVSVADAARERVAPVVTSAVALTLLLLPFLVMGSRPGLELLHPLAVVLVGGLVTVTLVTLVLLPALYLWPTERAVR